MSGSRLRVIQWTTGNVGRRALRAIVRHPNLELVGVFAHSSDKAGRDAADLCGADEDTGVVATTDVDALLALRPDACSYNPMWPDIDTPCALLDSGVNVCSTAGFITGRSMGEETERRLLAAAERGRSTMFGTGINPGFANLFALLSTQICDRVEQIRVLESADASTYARSTPKRASGSGSVSTLSTSWSGPGPAARSSPTRSP
jgi:2,4-diaminopentanoate dehydrogenase